MVEPLVDPSIKSPPLIMVTNSSGHHQTIQPPTLAVAKQKTCADYHQAVVGSPSPPQPSTDVKRSSCNARRRKSPPTSDDALRGPYALLDCVESIEYEEERVPSPPGPRAVSSSKRTKLPASRRQVELLDTAASSAALAASFTAAGSSRSSNRRILPQRNCYSRWSQPRIIQQPRTDAAVLVKQSPYKLAVHRQDVDRSPHFDHHHQNFNTRSHNHQPQASSSPMLFVSSSVHSPTSSEHQHQLTVNSGGCNNSDSGSSSGCSSFRELDYPAPASSSSTPLFLQYYQHQDNNHLDGDKHQLIHSLASEWPNSLSFHGDDDPSNTTTIDPYSNFLSPPSTVANQELVSFDVDASRLTSDLVDFTDSLDSLAQEDDPLLLFSSLGNDFDLLGSDRDLLLSPPSVNCGNDEGLLTPPPPPFSSTSVA